MKKNLSIVLALLLLLTACQALPDGDQSMASTPSSSGSITPPPSSSVVPPTSSTAPTVPTTQPTVPTTTPPETNPNLPPVPTDFDTTDGLAFRYYGPKDIVLSPSWKYTEGTPEHLYWVKKTTKEVFVICDEPIVKHVTTETHIFFVKRSEPTKIYVVAIGDFTNHQLYYESTLGNITNLSYVMYGDSEIKNYLQLVVDEKRFVMLNMITGEGTVVFETYRINSAWTYDSNAEWIKFEGWTAEDEGGLYEYNRITGELIIDDSL